MYIVGLFLMFLTCLVTGEESKYCFADDKNPYISFGTKAAYNFMHGHLTPDRNCTPIQLYVVARHGTRYPGRKGIPALLKMSQLRDKTVTNHEQHWGQLCNRDLENLKNWKLDDNVRENMADFLSPQGETDLKELAERLKAAFPELFTSDFSSNMNNYVFMSTNKQRTKESMLAFADGLLGTRSVTPIEPPNKDMLLRPNKKCPVWKQETGTSKFCDEHNKFNESLEMQSVLVDVSRRLGFQRNITYEEMNAIYDMCRFDKAWNINATSPWCAAFSKRELIVLEYREDLDYYYYVGPGREMNTKLGCPLMKDLFQHFRKLEGNDYSQEPKGIFYFAHSATLQTLLATLGFNNDPHPLLSSNFKESEGRLWRTSFVGPFATNLVAAFYKCGDTSNKVVFHWAEKLVELKDCNQGVCDWGNVRDTLGRKAEECNMDFCNVAKRN